MIGKQDIVDRAAEWRLRPDVVEKDYVLGWLLSALSASPSREHWIFKGGTCIKKCFVETYRFSEDLDFSLTASAPYEEHNVRDALVEMALIASNLSGLAFPEEQIHVRSRRDGRGELTYEGRVAYQGPLEVPSYPRVRFDLTRHEPVLEDPDSRSTFHPYPDSLPEGATVLTYTVHEILAEKVRALWERTRPRDLYDVVFLLRNQAEALDLGRVRRLFDRKCAIKELEMPSAADVVQRAVESAEMRSEWSNMLGHQLPSLPDLGGLLEQLPTLLMWLDEPSAILSSATLPTVPIATDHERIADASIRYWGGGAPLELVRFAGANRLLVEFDYGTRRRTVEPYSLRRAGTGNLLLYAWELGATHIKAFNVAEMHNVRATARSFQPRYRVEFSASGSSRPPSLARGR